MTVLGQIRAVLLGEYCSTVAIITNYTSYLITYWLVFIVMWKQGSISISEWRYVWSKGGEWRMLMVCGFLDTCANLSMYISQPHLPVIVLSIMAQSNLYWVAGWSFTFFRRRYTAIECMGVILSFCASMTVAYTACTSDASLYEKNGLAHIQPQYLLLLIFSCGCLTLSITLKQRSFRNYLLHQQSLMGDSPRGARFSRVASQRLNPFVVSSCCNTFGFCFMIPALFTIHGDSALQLFEDGFAFVFSNHDGVGFYLGAYTVVNLVSAIVVYQIIGWGQPLFVFIGNKLTVPATAVLVACFAFPVLGLQPFPPVQMAALVIEICGAALWFIGQRWRDENPDSNVCCYPFFKSN